MTRSYFICHYCCDYATVNKSDMISHLNKKKKCQCNSICSYEDAIILSSTKKYIFDFEIKHLSLDDYIYITTHYNDEINRIDKNFKKNKKNIESDCNSNELILKPYIPSTKTKNNYENVFYDEEKKVYICGYCKSSFTYLHNLNRHVNASSCENRKIKNEIIEKEKEKNNSIIQKEDDKKSIYNTYVDNSTNIQNINNTNISHNNTYNLSLKDFIHDKYDLTHIQHDFYQQKDFYLYHNFLRVIMENEKNQNIFFSNNEAIIFTDNELNKMSSDKAGYLILDKLSQSFEQLMNIQDDDAKNYYNFITKYYYLLKGQYKHDTIYKDYDIDEQKFIYTAQSNLFRSRDKYLNKIVSTINKFSENSRENMNASIEEIKNIQTINPSIEDFVSTKMRYRDLKDKS